MKKSKLIDFNEFRLFSPEILYTYRIYPRIDSFNYLKHSFYIYCYLDPSKCYLDDEKILEVDTSFKKFYFAYEPFYVGKGVNRVGYRFNHHINEFLANRPDSNIAKRQKFKEIEQKMRRRELPITTWQEYKRDFIILMINFDNEKDLLQCEFELIHNIGSIYHKNENEKGSLVNQILKYETDRFRRKQEDF